MPAPRPSTGRAEAPLAAAFSPAADPSSDPLAAPARLAALQATGLLNGVADPVLDHMTRVAARLLAVPVSMVTLVDDRRQHFPGLTGLAGMGGRAAAERGTPLSHSFCRHVVAAGAPLAIEDARTHPLVRDNPAIDDLGVRAYLGVPLRTRDGEVLGALCAIADDRREWDAAALTELNELAAASMAEIDLRIRHSTLAERERRAAFLVAFADATRALEEPSAVAAAALEHVRAHLGAQRVLVLEVEPDGEHCCLAGAVAAPDVPPMRSAGPTRLDAVFGAAVAAQLRAGEAVARGGTAGAATATLHVPLLRGGRLTAALGVVTEASRPWSHDEVALVRDVAERSWDAIARARAHEAVAVSERRHRAVLDALPLGVLVADPTGAFVEVNGRVAEIWGGAPGAAGIPDYAQYRAWWPDTGRPVAPEEWALARALLHGERCMGERMDIERFDGGRAVILSHAAPIHDVGGAPGGAVVAITDISAQAAADAERQEALRASEERYALAARVTSNVIWDWDLVADVVVRSDGMAAIFGHERATIDHEPAWWGNRVHPDDRVRAVDGLRAAVDDGRTIEWSADYRFLRGDGTWAEVLDRGIVIRDADGRPLRMIGAMEDVTTQRRLEARLRQAQKMEAIGQLAGGIAHDFNNLLSVIGGNLEFAQGDLPPELPADHPVRQDLDEVAHAAERARLLVRQLLAFGRKSPVHARPLSVGDVLRDAERMLRRVIGEEITLDVVTDDAGARVVADPVQLEQVLMNLAVNARDAMLTPLHGHPGLGGVLAITADVVTLDAAGAAAWDGAAAGRWVRLRVRDDGHGMDAATRAHAFEPFFTTKEVGRGTGLGLATTYGIVRQLGGAVRLDSAPGTGTTVCLLLPVSEATAADGEARPGAAPSARTSATVLLVEDETAVRITARRVLERHGYTVLEARHGRDAALVWQDRAAGIDVVVTDVRMPEMGGRELVERLRAEQPALPVVYVSGYSSDAEQWARGAHEAFVAKPFAGEALLAALDRVLAARDAPARPG